MPNSQPRAPRFFVRLRACLLCVFFFFLPRKPRKCYKHNHARSALNLPSFLRARAQFTTPTKQATQARHALNPHTAMLYSQPHTAFFAPSLNSPRSQNKPPKHATRFFSRRTRVLRVRAIRACFFAHA